MSPDIPHKPKPPTQPQHTRRKPAPRDTFEHPLAARYASPDMLALWSPQTRHTTWRRIWIAVAEAQHEIGLPVTAAQIEALREARDDIDFDAVAAYEKETRHDVMAHIRAFGDVAPQARGIIHLGLTSMDVVDNADLLLMRQAFDVLRVRLVEVVRGLAAFCEQYADMPALGFTHLQPAQLTTVGKRAALWLSDFVDDLEAFAGARDRIRFRGLRGATGTQASFLKLLGNEERVLDLEARVAQKLDFTELYPVCGQTYARKVDFELLATLASFAASVQKTCNDIRLLAMLKEIEEPFEAAQVGSSAMPYKRNPMRCERATGLARYLMSLLSSPLQTQAAQMLERTLDDSSNKRLLVPEAFLIADALALLMQNVLSGLVVYPQTITAHIESELPFIASEDILMEAVAQGGDRQELHERLRRHAQAAATEVKQYGRPNDLLIRLQNDQQFTRVNFRKLLEPARYVGLAPQQTRRFLRDVVQPAIDRHASSRTLSTDINV